MKKIVYVFCVVSLLALVACSGGGTAGNSVGNNPDMVPALTINEPSNSALAGAANLGSSNTQLPELCAGASDVNTASFAAEVIRLTNVERANAGLSPLAAQVNMNQAAQKQTIDMACNGFVGHTGTDGSDLGGRLDLFGYFWMVAGENVAAGYANPAAMVAGWMGSSGHRANMLDPEFTEAGVGYIYHASDSLGQRHYWTMDFGAR